MIFFIIVIAIGVLYFFYNYGQENAKQQTDYSKNSDDSDYPKQKRNYSEIAVFDRAIYEGSLKGVAFGNKSDAFDAVEVGDDVSVLFDSYNQYDKNALGVYIKGGKLLGYIEKDQRRLIKTLRNNPNHLAYIKGKKYLPPNEQYRNAYRSIYIELWVGYPDEELEKEKKKRIYSKRYYELNDQLISQQNTVKEFKDIEPKKAIEKLEEIMILMNRFNIESISDEKFKLPLNELTILTNKQGLFKKTVELGEKYLAESNLTKIQKEDISKRILKAKEKIKI